MPTLFRRRLKRLLSRWRERAALSHDDRRHFIMVTRHASRHAALARMRLPQLMRALQRRLDDYYSIPLPICWQPHIYESFFDSRYGAADDS